MSVDGWGSGADKEDGGVEVRIIVITMFCLLILTFGCNEPQLLSPRDTTINLNLVATTPTSAKLRISVVDFSDSWHFKLKRNDSSVAVGSCQSADTTVIDSNLTFSTNYSFRAFWLDGAEAIDSSNEISVKTDKLTKIFLTSLQHDSTSIQLKLFVKDSSATWFYELVRDSVSIMTGSVANGDTTITEDNLEPGKQYHYQAFWLENSTRVDSSEEILITTDWDAETLWYMSFYPLNIGYKWKYETVDTEGPIEYQIREIVADTAMPNHKIYFRMEYSDRSPAYVRFDPESKAIYIYSFGDSDEILLRDFSRMQYKEGNAGCLFDVDNNRLRGNLLTCRDTITYPIDQREYGSYIERIGLGYRETVSTDDYWETSFYTECLVAVKIDTISYGEF